MMTFRYGSKCCLAMALAAFAVNARAVDLKEIDRSIARSPKFESQPAYCLLVFGSEVSTRVWLVEDGKQLYVDRNANGDLTDDGEPVKATEEREMDTTDVKTNAPTTLHDWDYAAGDIKPTTGEEHTELKVIRWQFGKQPVQHGVQIRVGGKVPQYSGWGHVFALAPEKAPIMHFGGDYAAIPLRYKNFALDRPAGRLSIGFFCDGVGDSSSSRISIDALPKNIIPQCEIDWPSKEKPGETFRTKVALFQRCCYWEFYNEEFKAPDEAGEGTAHVTVTVPGILPFRFAKREFDLPVVQTGKSKDD